MSEQPERGKLRTLSDYPPPEDVIAAYRSETRCAHCGTLAPVLYDGSPDAAAQLGNHAWALAGSDGDMVLCPDCWNEYIAGQDP